MRRKILLMGTGVRKGNRTEARRAQRCSDSAATTDITDKDTEEEDGRGGRKDSDGVRGWDKSNTRGRRAFCRWKHHNRERKKGCWCRKLRRQKTSERARDMICVQPLGKLWVPLKDELKCLLSELPLPCCDVVTIQTINQWTGCRGGT